MCARTTPKQRAAEAEGKRPPSPWNWRENGAKAERPLFPRFYRLLQAWEDPPEKCDTFATFLHHFCYTPTNRNLTTTSLVAKGQLPKRFRKLTHASSYRRSSFLPLPSPPGISLHRVPCVGSFGWISPILVAVCAEKRAATVSAGSVAGLPMPTEAGVMRG